MIDAPTMLSVPCACPHRANSRCWSFRHCPPCLPSLYSVSYCHLIPTTAVAHYTACAASDVSAPLHIPVPARSPAMARVTRPRSTCARASPSQCTCGCDWKCVGCYCKIDIVHPMHVFVCRAARHDKRRRLVLGAYGTGTHAPASVRGAPRGVRDGDGCARICPGGPGKLYGGPPGALRTDAGASVPVPYTPGRRGVLGSGGHRCDVVSADA